MVSFLRQPMDRPIGSFRKDDPPIVFEKRSFLLLIALIDDPKGFFLRVLGKVEGCSSLLGDDIGIFSEPLPVGDVAV